MNHAPILTVIGSYPVETKPFQIMESYWNQLSIPSWETYISEAVNDMVTSGIQLVSDGQTRDPFVTIFARGLKGCRIRNRPEVIDIIEYNHPITVNDLNFVRKILPKGVKLLGLIVGPYTFSKTVSNQFYHDTEQLAFDAAKALHKEALAIEPYVDIISVDEPYFSNEFPPYGNDLIKIIVDGIKIKSRLHVCGDVSNIIPELLDLPVDILSHEFKATPKLFDSYKELLDSKKKFCIGSVRSDDNTVESVDEIANHINMALEVFGKNVEQLSPDCGLRFLPRDVAFEKLKNLRSAWENMFL